MRKGYLGDFEELVLRDKRVLVIGHTMEGLEEALPPEQFIRIYRSFIVALSAIESISGNQIEVATAQLPLVALYRERVLQKISHRRLS